MFLVTWFLVNVMRAICSIVATNAAGFTETEAAELDSLFSNSTLLVEKLESEDDSIFAEHRLGRVVGPRGEYGNQRLLAESSSGSVRCKIREQVSNESLIIFTLAAARGR